MKFFKELTEKINKTSETAKKHSFYFQDIMDLTTCCERTGKKNILEAIEDEIYPSIQEKSETMIVNRLSEELKLLVKKVDYKKETNEISNNLNDLKIVNDERYDDTAQTISTIKEENYIFKTEYVN